MNRSTLTSPRHEAFWLFMAIAVFFCIGLGARDYVTPSEARYIEIPRQMLVTGDWLTPRINGVPYFEKPPLFYWMQASVMHFLGTGEFAGRLITAVLAAANCVIAYIAARALYGRTAGLLTASVLATCVLGYGLSRVAMLDLPVSVFITATLTCFLLAQQSAHKTRLYLLMYVASALAVMTKGLIGMVIPGLVIGAWIIATKRWHILKEARLFTGLLVFLAIAAPWHMLMAQKHPQFLDFYFIHEHFTRYLSTEHRRTAPWWFFIAITLAGLMPWTGLLPVTLKRLKLRQPDTLLLVLWIALPLVFFSFSSSKLLSYIFPIFPPLAILIGRTLSELWEGALPETHLRRSSWLVIALFSALSLAGLVLPLVNLRVEQMLKETGSMSALIVLPVALALLALGYAMIRRAPARVLIGLLAGFGTVIGFNLNYTEDDFDVTSMKPLAQTLAPRLRKDDMVFTFANYWQDLPVYLGRDVSVVEWKGELEFGIRNYPETQRWMIGYSQFWEQCRKARQPVYVFAHQDTVKELTSSRECPLKPIAKYGKNELLERMTP